MQEARNRFRQRSSALESATYSNNTVNQTALIRRRLTSSPLSVRRYACDSSSDNFSTDRHSLTARLRQSQVPVVRANCQTSRSLACLTNDVIYGGLMEKGDEDNSNIDEEQGRLLAHKKQFEGDNYLLPTTLVNRGFYYTTMKDQDTSGAEQSRKNSSQGQILYSSEQRTAPRRQCVHELEAEGIGGHEMVNLMSAIDNHQQCRCDMERATSGNMGSSLVAKLNSNNLLNDYHLNKSQCYSTMPSKFSLSSVYAIRSTAPGKQLGPLMTRTLATTPTSTTPSTAYSTALSKHKRSKASGSSGELEASLV